MLAWRQEEDILRPLHRQSGNADHVGQEAWMNYQTLLKAGPLKPGTSYMGYRDFDAQFSERRTLRHPNEQFPSFLYCMTKYKYGLTIVYS